MAERTLLCEIVTPERIVHTSEARMVVVPTIDGEIGILPLHAPLVSVLRPGEIRIRYADDEIEWFAVSGGYIQVHEDKVIILADDAVAASQVDVEKARRAMELARQRLDDLRASEEAEADTCRRDLQWCEIQVEAAKKHG